jgi:glycopeptide antibiotics resistance protein
MTAKPNMALTMGAVVFAVLWTAWMVLWSGSYDIANVIILAVCGIAVGYFWYRAMRWQFRRRGLLQGTDASVDASAKQ